MHFYKHRKNSSWRVGRVVPIIRSAVLTTLRSLLRSDLVAELNQTVNDVQRTDSMLAEKNCFSSSCGRLNFLSWRRKYSLCWAFFTMDSMWLSHFRSWEIVVPRNLNDFIAVTLLFMMVTGGRARGGGGVSPEVHDYLHCFERVKLQVVKTAPDSQLLNLLSVSRLVTVLHEADQCGVVCRLQELDRGVSRCAVIRVQGEEQWGENTALRSSSADRTGAGWGRSVWCRLQTSGAWQRGL